jgi:hypothetical protein
MLCKSGCHHWRDRLPTSQRSGASRWFRLWQRQMRRSQRQPQVSLTPREVFGEVVCTPCEATIALTRRQGGASTSLVFMVALGGKKVSCSAIICGSPQTTVLSTCTIRLWARVFTTWAYHNPRWRAGAVVWDSILDSRYTASWEAQHTIMRHKRNPPLGYLYERPPA